MPGGYATLRPSRHTETMTGTSSWLFTRTRSARFPGAIVAAILEAGDLGRPPGHHGHRFGQRDSAIRSEGKSRLHQAERHVVRRENVEKPSAASSRAETLPECEPPRTTFGAPIRIDMPASRDALRGFERRWELGDPDAVRVGIGDLVDRWRRRGWRARCRGQAQRSDRGAMWGGIELRIRGVRRSENASNSASVILRFFW